MKEFGMAVEIELPDPVKVSDEMIATAKRMLAFNYLRTKDAHPEWELPPEWEFVIGPVHPAYDYEVCGACHGDGKWWEWEMENDDIGGEVACQECDGEGWVIVGLKDPPRWKHSFGWYVTTD